MRLGLGEYTLLLLYINYVASVHCQDQDIQTFECCSKIEVRVVRISCRSRGRHVSLASRRRRIVCKRLNVKPGV